ncbi:MAG: HAD family phosphatase [Bacteroidia bacterium]|nr:HAD family phosphatase [Bacteroidia bacterium]
MIAPDIKNVIFDLGGVIINLSTQTTANQFAQLGGISVEEVKHRMMESTEFHDYEKGLISDIQFREIVREMLQIGASDSEIDRCWNAMLLDIPLERIQLLERIRDKYRIFLLSNTNEIHLTCFTGIVKKVTGKSSLDLYFEKAYYSHRMKMRKPDRAIYEVVLAENNLNPLHTIFLDDNLLNLKGAEHCGIKTFHVQHPDLIFTLFP